MFLSEKEEQYLSFTERWYFYTLGKIEVLLSQIEADSNLKSVHEKRIQLEFANHVASLNERADEMNVHFRALITLKDGVQKRELIDAAYILYFGYLTRSKLLLPLSFRKSRGEKITPFEDAHLQFVHLSSKFFLDTYGFDFNGIQQNN